MSDLTFGSLFAGIGGFDLGFERAGMTCRWQVEIDDYANRVLAKHWPDVARYRDIRSVGWHNLSPVDVICGGFPCQDVSRNGTQAGIYGRRSGLFAEAIRVVGELRPRCVVLENVAGLLDGGLGEVLASLSAIGFDAEWDVVPACGVGADQIRERVFILAYPECGWMEGRWRASSAKTSCIKRAGIREFESPGGTIKADATLSRIAERETHWERESGIHRVANGIPSRVDRLRGLGNAVVPQVAEFIGRQIVEALNVEVDNHEP